MTAPRVTLLVNAGPQSIEAVRARGLTQTYPPERVRCLFREGSRFATLRRWQRELSRSRPDLLYVLNTALPGVPLAVWWRRAHGVPYILDTGDAIVEMARRSGIGAGWRLPVLQWLESAGQHHAATVVVRGSRHREHLYRSGIERVELIRDGYAKQPDVSTNELQDLRVRLGLTGRFVAGVLGSLVMSPRLGICYGWDLVRALADLRDLPISALVIGDGNGLEWLRTEANRLRVTDQVRFTGRIPYREVPKYLRLMDVALSTQTNNLPGQVRTTGKLPEYMAAGRFILASRVGEAALVLPEPMLLDYDGEVDQAYPRRVAERIRYLHAQPSALEIRRTLPPKAAELCAYPVLAEQFRAVVLAARNEA